ncbi:hypothetical protein BJ993_005032 [Nocardioides aromaticivorans]|jgi:hypothetical protein|uniref:Uncharacterized protein n=2 Tax=Nocardioides TaxID=1839 RepID=A0A7Y9ZN23_9ACTN|nr:MULTISPECIES: hypothetical protein [Nocardioides]MAO79125.1 hypothetical protein [Nocardioides sp.]NYI47886.1 hypothetical protein [Nocardioides aromaticivorans]QSR30196.1 hypothetical protein CFI00_06630 [Nocardioides sp. S5]GGO85271.1 hypothetical protein GCM10011584_04810 [Nocardioides phosphati]|tara:strand:+ start:37 stop:345 length:309 start_codon:yes stop_codon:yes gene_type:complete
MAEVVLDYPHRQAEHCASGALRDLMEWEGLGWAGTGFRGRLAGALAAAQGSRITCPVTFSVTAPDPAHASRCGVSEPECPHRLEDVAYAQVRRRTVKIRANF